MQTENHGSSEWNPQNTPLPVKTPTFLSVGKSTIMKALNTTESSFLIIKMKQFEKKEEVTYNINVSNKNINQKIHVSISR